MNELKINTTVEIIKSKINLKLRLKIWLVCLLFNFKFSKFDKFLYSQTVKGFQNHKKTILDCGYNDYNYNDMGFEELADLVVYHLKENKKI